MFGKLKIFNKGVLIVFLLLLFGLAYTFGKGYNPQSSTSSKTPPKPNKQEISTQTNQTTQDKAVLGKRSPYISVSGGRQDYSGGGVISLSSTDDPSVQISGYDISGPVEVSVYEANDDLLLSYLTHDKEGKQVNKKADVKKLHLVKTLTHNITSNYGDGEKLLLPLKEKGIWLLRIKKDNFSEDSFVVRSSIGAIAKEGDNQFIFWGQNFKTKRSISNEGIVILYNLQDKRQELERSPFDGEGIAKAKLTKDADIALVAQNDERAIIPINLKYLNYSYQYDSFRPKEKETKYFVFTDRPLYRPGDKVYFKTVLRDDDDARYTIPTGLAKVKVYDGWGEESLLSEKNYDISPDGTINGEYDIPKTGKTGYYRLTVSTPGSTEFTHSFNVEFFRKPEYSIDIDVKNREFIAKDKSSFKITGNYFSGQPLVGKTVKYKIYSADFYEYDYLADRNYLFSDDYRYGYWGGSVVKSGDVTFNSSGEAEVDLDTSLPMERTKSQVFSIEAEFDDGSGNPSFARKNVVVYSGEYGIYRKDYSYYSSSIGKELPVPLKLVSYRNTNIANIKLSAKIHRENWVPYYTEKSKYPEYKKEEEDLSTLDSKTDKDGNVTFKFTPKKVGSYIVKVTGEDARGNKISKEFYTYVSSSTETFYTGGQDNELTIQLDKQQYEPKDTIHFTITSSIPKRDVFLSMERARVNRFKIVHLDNKVTNFDYPIEDTDIPNIYAKVSGFSDETLDEGLANVVVSKNSKKLVVKVTPDRKTYGPSQDTTINIETTDISGNPVSSDVGLWAVDKAIFELVDEKPGKIFDTFWSERYDNTQEAHSLEGITNMNAERGGCFDKDTKILMSDGSTKDIKDIKIGDIILTRENETSQKLVRTKVKDVHKAVVSGYFILNGNLKITSNHRLWVNNSWKEASLVQTGDNVLDKNGKKIKITSIEWISGKFDVYNLSIENYQTFFANGIWVHNQKGGGARTIFKDTAYWNPQVHTDSDGRAKVTFKLPDNLTTWVVAAVGSTVDTKVGQETQEIVVTKDIIVRPVLPNILRTEDKIVVSALIQNFTEKNQTFNVNLKFDSGDIDQSSISGLLIKSKAMQQVYWTIYPKKDNEKAKLTFSAKSLEDKNSTDTIVSEIPVRTFGFLDQRAATGNGSKDYTVKLAEDVNRSKSSVTLSLAPTILGTLPTAMNYLVQYPYGCVEQTTSRFVPAVLAKANADLFKDSLEGKDLNDMIEKGLARLSSLQKSDGGWTWWYSGKSDYFITAYVAEYILMAKESGINVDKDMLTRAQNFLEQQDKGTKREDMIAKNYALTLLGVKDKVQIFNESYLENLSADLVSLAVMANYLNGDQNPKTNGLLLLEGMAKTQGDSVFWSEGKKENFASTDASTAFAIRAIVLANGNRDLATKGARYLINNRHKQYWSNTFATAQIIRSVIDLVKSGDELKPDYAYTVSLDGSVLASGNLSDSKQLIKDITIPTSKIKEAGSKISIKKDGDGQIYSTLLINEFHTDKSAKAQSNGILIKREYTNDKGDGYSLSVGDTVTVKLTVKGLNASEFYGIIDDDLPSGMIPINQVFKNEQYDSNTSGYYPYNWTDNDVKENGMHLSLYQVYSGENTYTYKARVISEGTFIVPPATASLMYTPEINGRSDVQTVTITKESSYSPKILPNTTPPVNVYVKGQKGAFELIKTLAVSIVLIVVLIVLFRFHHIVLAFFERKNDNEKTDNSSTPQDEQESNK